MRLNFLQKIFRRKYSLKHASSGKTECYKGRQYPIKYDEYGKTARKRAFKLFDECLRPAQVAPQVGISLKTACRYFQDWKKLPMNFEEELAFARYYLKDPESRRSTMKILAETLNVPLQELEEHLRKPWGIRRFLFIEYRERERERAKTSSDEWNRLRAAIDYVSFWESVDLPAERQSEIIEEFIKAYSSEQRKIRGDDESFGEYIRRLLHEGNV